MNPLKVILIFDIGKTNKKLFLFDVAYSLVYEKSVTLKEIVDDDGDVCEDIKALSNWMLESISAIQENKNFEIKAIHYASYGASLVYLDAKMEIVTPLYNYLKPFKEANKNLLKVNMALLKKFVWKRLLLIWVI